VLKRVEVTKNSKIVQSWPQNEQIYCYFTWSTTLRWNIGWVVVARVDVFTTATTLKNVVRKKVMVSIGDPL
jgi:hypothetical protein